MTEIRITTKHIRMAKVCMDGARYWFTDRGYSWIDFLENGAPISMVETIDDPFAIEICRLAREDALNE